MHNFCHSVSKVEVSGSTSMTHLNALVEHSKTNHSNKSFKLMTNANHVQLESKQDTFRAVVATSHSQTSPIPVKPVKAPWTSHKLSHLL